MTDKQHSKIGASSCERWWNCPGSIALIEQAPPSKSSIYAAEGTVAHTIGERYLRALKPVDTEYLGTVIHQDGFDIEVTEEMLDAVSVYVDFVLEEMRRYKSSPGQLMIEVGFNLHHIDPEAYGTCDAGLFVPLNKLVVIDYKHGQGVAVESANNKQTLYYALGAYWQLPEEDRNDICWIETVIVQPRAAHSEGGIRRTVYTVSQLVAWQAELFAAVQRIRRGVQTLSAGAHCKFCPAKPICPEARDEVSRQAAIDFGGMPSPLLSPRKYSPDDLARLLKHIDYIEDWCSDVRYWAHQVAETGITIPGYMLAAKRANRKWKDEDEAATALRDLGDKLYTRKLVSPAQAEKLLPKERRYLVNDLSYKPATGKTLVPITAPNRDQLLPRAITDFDGVTLDI